MTWWQGGVLYQVYLRSFADSNGDGVGDIEGIRSRLPYLKSLGIDAIWVTPFFPSPMVDHGYDVADPRGVDAMFGSLDDFDALIRDAHAMGIRVCIEIVPNHSSSEHPWFVEALAAPAASAARERYIFRPPADDGGPPNNWVSVFGGSAWTMHEPSGEYYLHLFAPEQPDLNWRNPEVVADAEETLRFWLDRGVDGFRIDVAHGLFKDAELRSNPVYPEAPERNAGFSRMEQRHTFDQDEVHEIYRSWRQLVESYGDDRVLLGEVFLWDPSRVARYVRDDELHLAFSFLLLGQKWSAADLKRAIAMSIGDDGSGETKNAWALSNHDLPRHTTRFGGGAVGERRARAAALLTLGLPGTAVMYMGEELGLEDAEVPPPLRQDPMWFRSGGAVPGRDACRTPFPWTKSPHAGFSEETPWLPVPDDWWEHSVEALDSDTASILHLYRAALRVRRGSQALRSGTLAWCDPKKDVLAFERRAGAEAMTVVVNAGPTAIEWRHDGALALTSADGVTDRGGALSIPPDTAVWIATDGR
jgi:alpha-glucosidase